MLFCLFKPLTRLSEQNFCVLVSSFTVCMHLSIHSSILQDSQKHSQGNIFPFRLFILIPHDTGF